MTVCSRLPVGWQALRKRKRSCTYLAHVPQPVCVNALRSLPSRSHIVVQVPPPFFLPWAQALYTNYTIHQSAETHSSVTPDLREGNVPPGPLSVKDNYMHQRKCVRLRTAGAPSVSTGSCCSLEDSSAVAEYRSSRNKHHQAAWHTQGQTN